MKELFALCALVLVLGAGGFLYRNALEHPGANTNRTYTICSTEAQMCPDGTTVTRTGASCQFTTCPFPNIELPTVSIAYAIPQGFSESGEVLSGAEIARYVGGGLAASPESRIVLYRYSIPEGKIGNDVALATAVRAGGTIATSMLEFSPMIVNGIKVETIELAGEGIKHTAYYLLRDTDVLRFDAIDPVASSTPAHQALVEQFLTTLQLR